MLGDARKQLLEYLKQSTYITSIHYVENRIDGMEDGKGTAYLRLVNDASSNNYVIVDRAWQADFYLVIDVTGEDKDCVLSYYESIIANYNGSFIRVNSAGVNNDAIYFEETFQENTTDCEFIRIGFTMSVPSKCMIC